MSAVITSKTIDENTTITFLRDKLSEQFFAFTALTYAIASKTIKEYCPSAYWGHIELSNKGFYLCPLFGCDKLLFQNKYNEYKGHVSEDAAGIIVTILSLNVMRHKFPLVESFCNYQKALIEYVNFHDEKMKILAAVAKQKYLKGKND